MHIIVEYTRSNNSDVSNILLNQQREFIMSLNLRTLSTVVTQLGVISVFALSVNAQAADLPSAKYLPLEMAQTAANAALAKCKADGYNVSVAIVARSGETKVLIKADGSGPHTAGSSIGKAFTSASMDQPTGNLAKMIMEKPDLEGLRDMDSRLVILNGGLPIKLDGALVGGIGVGGAPGGHLDAACAKAGLAAIGIK